MYRQRIKNRPNLNTINNKLEKKRNQPRKLWGTWDEITGRSSRKTIIEQIIFEINFAK